VDHSGESAAGDRSAEGGRFLMAFRVLVIDDSPAMRGMIRRVIQVSGLDAGEIFEASDGQEALDLLEREWVDVILTDINMPRMDGEEFVRRMAASGLTESIPIVVISTDATQVRREHLQALGVRGYLVKPFQPEALKEQIERAVETSHVQ
jgi:two-component system, chemotaxis family, chemotaxis protein CheY